MMTQEDAGGESSISLQKGLFGVGFQSIAGMPPPEWHRKHISTDQRLRDDNKND